MAAQSEDVPDTELSSKPTFEGWKYAHYFAFISRKGKKNLTVKCKLCPGHKTLSTAWNTTSNLLKHLQSRHKNSKLLARDPRQTGAAESPPDSSPTGSPRGSPRRKQAKLSFQDGTSKAEVNRLVASYIVEEMLPLSTVESPSFRNILSKIKIIGKGQPTTDRKTFTAYLDNCYKEMEIELKQQFETVEFVSTTADIWSSHNKSYMGMTAHWIDPADFSRKKAALACKRIKGRHTYDVVAEAIEEVHSAYGLTHKVTATVTDNGSNFVKAFKVYEAQPAASDSEDEGGDEEEQDEEVTFTNVREVLSSDQDGQFTLPPHLRCASHTLNLISTNDIEKWLTTHAECKAVYRSATGKCAGLWNKASRSTTAAELVDSLCGKKLIVPTVTRWNSFHDAIKRITEIPMPKLTTLCSQLGIKAIAEREYQFLKEYCTVTKPLAAALDELQGEDKCYYGCLLPALEVLMSKTLARRDGLSRMTAGLPDAIVQVGATVLNHSSPILYYIYLLDFYQVVINI